jgi:hypothetical protein
MTKVDTSTWTGIDLNSESIPGMNRRLNMLLLDDFLKEMPGFHDRY